MKKFSRDERLGAILLAVVVVAAIIVAFCARTCSHGTESSETHQVTVIYKDSTDNANSSDKKAKDKKQSKSGRKKKGRKKSKSAQTPARAPRDFLADTIPTVQ